MKQALLSHVSSWKMLFPVFRYSFFHDYYSVAKYGKDVVQEVWDVRRIIWSFKKNASANQMLLVKVLKLLQKTFGSNLSHLTLVCIPASKKQENETRYKRFSELLCEGLGMINAYDYINILYDRDPKHTGGTTTLDNLNFDASFFKDKNILIFDDLITNGDSMKMFHDKMISLGANVICGMSIGKSK